MDTTVREKLRFHREMIFFSISVLVLRIETQHYRNFPCKVSGILGQSLMGGSLYRELSLHKTLYFSGNSKKSR